ncbi:effector protein NopP [Bradyrhizobium erythrophlei]|uniref:effector protein NopP n=1 Tax=Bradyrhizobium erythrophlei TaxID=1437360 RepID=UPI0035EDAE60
MHDGIRGSSSVRYTSVGEADQANPSRANAEQTDAEGRGFADMFANMHLAAEDSNASSSSIAPAYSLLFKPPVVEINKETFRRLAKTFHDDEINRIAKNPQEYSDFVSTRAKNAAEAAAEYGTTTDSEHARYFSYQLGNKSVALLRTEEGFSMTEFDGEKWRELFPGRTDITSTVDLQVVHPLVENAGDILLEHQLRLDGERPLLKWYPLNEEAKARAAMMGFVEVDDCNMVLDPTQHPDKWTKNSAGEWQRANKPPLYLSKAEESESSATESATDPTYPYEDDFM